MFVSLRDYVGNRRRSPRRILRLPASVSVRSAPEMDGAVGAFAVEGFTRDVSKNGIALVMPAIRAGSVYLTREGTVLHITITLRDGLPLEFEGAPVRYHNLEETDETGGRYMIGVQITRIGDAERRRLNALLASVKT